MKKESREIVYYHEQHTLMCQDVSVLIDENMLKTMLNEDLTEETKRELIQTLYVCFVDQEIVIHEKHHYGAWNAKIGEIKHIYQYQQTIYDKLKGHITNEELKNNFDLINLNILALSENEIEKTAKLQKKMYDLFNTSYKSLRI